MNPSSTYLFSVSVTGSNSVVVLGSDRPLNMKAVFLQLKHQDHNDEHDVHHEERRDHLSGKELGRNASQRLGNHRPCSWAQSAQDGCAPAPSGPVSEGRDTYRWHLSRNALLRVQLCRLQLWKRSFHRNEGKMSTNIYMRLTFLCLLWSLKKSKPIKILLPETKLYLNWYFSWEDWSQEQNWKFAKNSGSMGAKMLKIPLEMLHSSLKEGLGQGQKRLTNYNAFRTYVALSTFLRRDISM